MVPDHLTEWLGLPVVNWTPDSEVPDFENEVYRLSYVPPKRSGFLGLKKEASKPVFDAFVSHSGVEKTQGLILSSTSDYGGDIANDIKQLLNEKSRFPNLRALFLGELVQEECELSWIQNGDCTPVLDAFPGLVDLRIRGGNELRLGESRHICLKKLVIETGGLNAADVLPGIHGSIFPELEHLEIWPGEENYGWGGTVEDFRPFFYDNPFPKLKYLGVRNAEIGDEVARIAAQAPVIEQIDTLDLSLGTVREAGGAALLESETVRSLKTLNLSHHFMSPALVAQFEESDLNADVSERQEPDDWGDEDGDHYYVAVGE